MSCWSLLGVLSLILGSAWCDSTEQTITGMMLRLRTGFGILRSPSVGELTFLSSTDPLLMVAKAGETVVLPCGAPSIKPCSSVTWNIGAEVGSIFEVVMSGGVTAGNGLRNEMLEDCSLRISQVEVRDARIYSCVSDVFNSSVSLQILELTENPISAEGTVELQCYLTKYAGYSACGTSTGIRIQWLAEDESALNGSRFSVNNPSNCFSKLLIKSKQTDHHRTWKCRLSQNHHLKATVGYTTTVKDGIEEVFAAVGDHVTLSCGTSSLGVEGSVSVDWVVCERSASNASSVCSQTDKLHSRKEPRLLLSTVTRGNAGNYTCSQSTGPKQTLNNIRLHTLDITAQPGQGVDDITLTCVLTCATACDKDFSLTWSGNNALTKPVPSVSVGDTLVKHLTSPGRSVTCSVHREGVLVASKHWQPSGSTLQHPALLLLPLCIVLGAALTGAVACVLLKRKYKTQPGREESSMEMTNDYETIQDVTCAKGQQQNTSHREALATTDSFYDLLQAVH